VSILMFFNHLMLILPLSDSITLRPCQSQIRVGTGQQAEGRCRTWSVKRWLKHYRMEWNLSF